MIFDAHTHLGFNPNTGVDVGIGELFEMCSHYGIDKCLAVNRRSIHYDFREGNRELMEICRGCEEGVVPVAYFDPGWGEEAVEEFMGAAKMGFRVAELFLQAGDSYRLGRIVSRMLEAGKEAGFVVFLECGHSTEDLHFFAERFSEIPFLISLTGEHMRELYSPLFELRNTYLVLDLALLRPDSVRWGADLLGVERLIFGSGWPEQDPARGLSRVGEAALSEEERGKIFGDNLLRVLGEKK